ncbi:MAG: damage-inducible protein DinB [Acetobacteraceae bacterium]|nr:damage-inducible protein DinB [Acetobacteraceae bacterium]
MITPAYICMMTAYGMEMNRRIYAAAALMTDEQRKQDRGLFWKSLHGTLNHLIWGDTQWMSRFADWEKPAVGGKQSAALFDDFSALRSAREAMDRRLTDWAAQVSDAWLGRDQNWYSGAAGRDMVAPRQMLMVHFFNHQTHHRGQAHAALTACGHDPGDTDLFLIVGAS